MGSDYWSLTIDCAKFVYNTMCQEDALMKYFKYSYAPSEMLVHTIVFNSKYSKQAIGYLGDYPGLSNLTPLHYIIYDKSIKIFTEFDIKTLLNSNKMFFRKATTGKSEHLITILENLRLV